MAELRNPLLDQLEQRIEGNLAPEIRPDYLKIVVAGMHIMLAKGKLAAQKIASDPDPVANVAKGAVGLVLAMRHQSKGEMPIKAMVPAGTTLMLKGLDFVSNMKIAVVDNAQVVRAMRIYTNTLFKALHVSPQMVMRAAQRVHGIMQNPEQMELINQRAGITKRPGAQPAEGGTAAPAAPAPPASRGLINGGA